MCQLTDRTCIRSMTIWFDIYRCALSCQKRKVTKYNILYKFSDTSTIPQHDTCQSRLSEQKHCYHCTFCDKLLLNLIFKFEYY